MTTQAKGKTGTGTVLGLNTTLRATKRPNTIGDFSESQKYKAAPHDLPNRPWLNLCTFSLSSRHKDGEDALGLNVLQLLTWTDLAMRPSPPKLDCILLRHLTSTVRQLGC